MTVTTSASGASIEFELKDASSLTDAEMGEMADLSAAGLGWEAGLLSKQANEWVLASQAFVDGRLAGFLFSTLERIGGTPALLLGAGCTAADSNERDVLTTMMHGQFHKTLMAFPDEDVLVASRLVAPGALGVFEPLRDVRPWPDTRPSGEDRAWGRRLAKRFGSAGFDDRTMQGHYDDVVLALDCQRDVDGSFATTHETLFDGCEAETTRHVIVWGWAMAEFLEQFESPLH